jgi:hypothetical protein
MEQRRRIACVTMVASESDIIESFARHTLGFVDHLHIQFHNSYDSSQEIVERLIGDGCSISFERGSDPVFRRQLLGDRLVRQAANGGHFDFILPLDADEFIVADSRSVLEAELAEMPPVSALTVNWLSYVPTEYDDPADPNPITRIRHRLRSPHVIHKAFFAASMLSQGDIYLSDGNHHLLSKTGREIPHRLSQRIFLAHFPVRSAQQLASKIAIGWAARVLSPDFTDNQSRHWRATDPAAVAGMTIKQLTRYAVGYLDSNERQLVEDPLSTAAQALAHGDLVRVDAFQRLSALIAALWSRGAAAGRLLQVLGEANDADRAADAERRKLLTELESADNKVHSLYQHIAHLRQAILRYRRSTQILAGLNVVLLIVLGMVIFLHLR